MSRGRGVEETVIVAVVGRMRLGWRWSAGDEAGDGVDEGAVGTRERVKDWPGLVGEGLGEVAKGDMINDACVGVGLEEVGARIVVRWNGCFVRAEEPRDVG